MLPIINYLKDNYNAELKVLLRNENMLEERNICDKNRIDYIIFKRQTNSPSNPKNNNQNLNKNNPKKNNFHYNIIRKFIIGIRSANIIDKVYRIFFRIKVIFKEQSLIYQNAYKLLMNERPSAILVINDIRIDLELFVLKIASILKIPTIQIGWSYTLSVPQAIQLQLNREKNGIILKNNDWKIRLFKYLIPDLYGEMGNERILFNDPLKILVSKYFGLRTSSPKNRGKNIDALTVTSDSQKNIYLNRGINEKKITVTGAPTNDELVYLRKNKNKIRTELSSNLKIKKTEIIILVVSSPLGFLNRNENQNTIDIIVMLLKISPEIQVLFKPHPAEDINDFEYLKTISNRVTVTNSYSVRQLAILSHLFITIASSSIIDAIGLNVPVVVYDFTNMNYIDRFPYTKAVKRSFNLDSLENTAKDILYNVDARKKIIKVQRNRIKPFAIFDGQCTQRTASLIQNYINYRSLN